MQEKLAELKLNALMEKFGAGGHKPGAGSAAALQGMIAAKLIKTVIELSINRKQYANIKAELIAKGREIEDVIYPKLNDLMQLDSEIFHKVIEYREARDKESSAEIKSQLASKSLDAQRMATEIPLDIARYCVKLVDHAIFVFDHGFKSARGDSSVAINCAVSSIGSCLSIIDLNLLSFVSDEWTDQISTEADLLKTAHGGLLEEAVKRQEVLHNEAVELNTFYTELDSLCDKINAIKNPSKAQIENFANSLQVLIWNSRKSIWKDSLPDAFGALSSKKILKKLGYQFTSEPDLGYFNEFGDTFEVAGKIDGTEKYVTISEKFKPEIRNFTTAHELGHALLHPGMSLHRDMPLDGSTVSRDIKEKQADFFAACFLMPGKLVKKWFSERFKTEKFSLNEQSALALGERISDLRKKIKSKEDLSKMLASATFYDKPFNSLAKQFNVSEAAMGIRLEELGLVHFD